ncbi:hypothetical protein ACXC9Q_13430 [Kribbella sp. CWNU-51]
MTTPGAPARAWPRDTDPPWITPDDTARLNPWGDTPDERPTRAKRPPATDVDPWGDTPDERPARARPRSSATDFDPWGDAPDERPTRAKRPPATDVDPWGEGSDDRPSGVVKDPVEAGTDPWGDDVKSIATIDRRTSLGTDDSGALEPWGEATTSRSEEATTSRSEEAATSRSEDVNDPNHDGTYPHPTSSPHSHHWWQRHSVPAQYGPDNGLAS